MRVVAGTARGLRLVAPAGRDVRPTLDRVREAAFNALGSLDAVRGAAVLDLFAGSGALGIEALSRGADHVTFVDVAAASLDAVRTNLDTTDLAERATVLRSDVLAALDVSHPRIAGPYDLVLADPPYDFDGWAELLDALGAVLAPDATVVAESATSSGGVLADAVAGVGGTILRQRSYGGTVVTMMTLHGHADDGRETGELRGWGHR